ncbi:MAG: LemA family protein [Candidatus Paceibacterota bacterium]
MKVVPNSIIAGMFNFTAEDFFKAGEADKKSVKVSF